jgi:hypothetical protein
MMCFAAWGVLSALSDIDPARIGAQGAPNPRLVDRDVMVYALFRNAMIAFWRCALSP